MDELQLIEFLRGFANGNTLVALYMTISFVRYIITPIYRNGKLVKSLVQSLQTALDEGVFGHKEIVAELKALSEVLRSQRQHP